MGVFDNFPYTNIHDLNTDWLVKTVKEVKDKTDEIDQSVTDAQQYAENARTSEINAHTAQLNAEQAVQDAINISAELHQYTEDTYDAINARIIENTNDIRVNSARIDSFTQLAVGSTTGDAELIDGRTGYNGTTYANIGDAIRGQVGDIHDILNADILPLIDYEYDYNTIDASSPNTSIVVGRIDTSGNLITSATNYHCLEYQVLQDCWVWCITNASDSYFATYNAQPYSSSTLTNLIWKTSFPTADNPVFVARNSYILLEQKRTTDDQVLYISYTKNAYVNENGVRKFDITLFADITSITDTVPGYLNTSGNLSVPTGNKEICTDYIPIENDQIINVSYGIPVGNSNWIRYALYDANLQFKVRRTNAGSIVRTDSIYNYYDFPLDTSYSTPIAFIRFSYRTYDHYDLKLKVASNSSYLYDKITSVNTSLSSKVIKLLQFPSDYELPINSAHRSMSSVNLPENTIPAFKDCHAHNWKWIETDLRKTVDGEWVLLHDASINRTGRNMDGTPIGTTIDIDTITLAQALTYDFGIYAGNQYAGTKIGTLEDILKYCRLTDMNIQLDVKVSSLSSADAISIFNLLEKYNMVNRIMLVSSSINKIEELLKIDQSIPACLTANATWTYVDPDTFAQSDPYILKYKTGINKVFYELETGNFASDVEMNNFIDCCKKVGVHAGVYAPGTVSAIENLSYNFDIVCSQYFKYNEVKAEQM